MLQLHINGILLSSPFPIITTARFRPLFSSSTTATTTTTESPNLFADYLVKSLGFSKEEAIATSLRLKYPNSKRSPNSVINFFKQNGFDETQIKKIVTRDPKLLKSDVEKTLKPKFRVLQELGFSPSDLREYYANCKVFLLTRISTRNLVAAVDFITQNFGSENVAHILKKSWMFSVRVASRNVTLLQNHGVSAVRIQKLFIRHPQMLQLSPKRFEALCAHIEENFGISVESSVFPVMILILASQTPENLGRKYKLFRSFGWTQSDILTMIRKVPDPLKQSEATLRKKLEYYMTELGLEAEYIASRPSFLTYSLEKRVIPRNAVLQVLKQRKLIRANLTLIYALNISEAKFLKNLVLPYEDELPGLFEAYRHNKMDSLNVPRFFVAPHGKELRISQFRESRSDEVV